MSKVHKEFLREFRESLGTAPATGPGIQTSRTGGDLSVVEQERVIGVAILQTAGINPIRSNLNDAERKKAEEVANRANDNFRGMSLIEFCREGLRLHGHSVGGSRSEIAQRAVSTGSMTNIFTTSVNALLLQSYNEAQDSTEGWVRVRSVMDFKTQDRIRLGKQATLQRHARGGKAEHGTRSDSIESYKAHRYSRQMLVDEQDLIDDRLNALTELPMEMGLAARRVRPDLVYSLLLANAALGADSTALFDVSTHANLITTAFSATVLETAIASMAKQTEDGVNLNIMPRFLIVPHDLRFSAEIALTSAQRIVASSSGGTYNPLLGMGITLVSDNRIGAAGVTDPATGTPYTGLATNWFLAADPVANPTIEVGYVEGRTEPQLSTFVKTGEDGMWGINWAVKLDIGVKALDYRGLFKSTGAG